MPERGKTERFSTFEESLLELEKECKEPVPIKKILTKLSGKGKTILLIVLCIPLGQIIGFSVFFGLLIAFLGFKMAFYKNAIWLPASLLKKKIPGKILKKLIRNILFPLKKLRSVSRPRSPFFWKSKQMQRGNSFLLGTIGICLALSPPIPLTSYIASIAILLLAMGLLNEDGTLIAISYPIALTYIVFVVLSLKFFSLKEIFLWIKDFV